MPATDRSTKRALGSRRVVAEGLSAEDAEARGMTAIPQVVSAAAFAAVGSRPWTRSKPASGSPPPSRN